MDTGRVKLDTTFAETVVHGDEVVADQVLSGWEGWGDREACRAVRTSGEVRHIPIVCARIFPKFAYFEKLGFGGIKCRAAAISAGGHEVHHPTNSMDPSTTFSVAPAESNGGTRSGVSDEARLLSIVTTVEIRIVCTLYRIDRIDRPNDILGRILQRHRCGIVLAVNPNTRKSAMSGHQRRKGGKGEESELSKHGGYDL